MHFSDFPVSRFQGGEPSKYRLTRDSYALFMEEMRFARPDEVEWADVYIPTYVLERGYVEYPGEVDDESYRLQDSEEGGSSSEEGENEQETITALRHLQTILWT